jgi:EAL domain-containing protein (putative c-di-GMP-specific phosphodiesterase class I)
MHGNDAQTLLRRGDMAVSMARRAQTTVICYKSEYEQDSMLRLALMGALRQAIKEEQLFLVYQPQANLATGVIHGVEALVRWQHAVYGVVSPDRFIPLAEQMGLITPLTHWALETAIRQCKVWREAGQDLVVSVNLSMWDLRDVTLPERIVRLLETYDVPASSLRVEMTESAIMNDKAQAMEILHRISEQGVSISIDDFGTGYSSLAYLKDLPVDELKIDRSFISNMVNDAAGAMIVEATIALAHGLGLRVIAEGVEDLKTWNLLADLGCDSMQGYYLSRPLSVQDLDNLFVRKRHALGTPGPSLLAL